MGGKESVDEGLREPAQYRCRSLLNHRRITGALAIGWIGIMGAVMTPTGGHAQAMSSRSGAPLVPHVVGAWRVSSANIAPWVTTDSASLDRARYIARIVRFGATTFTGLTPFDCTDARFEPTQTSPDGLFQGGLPTPARAAAQALGLDSVRISGVRLTCASGIFEFHAADANHLLVAIDNVILTLDRSPGALAPTTSPAGVVHAVLEQHFRGGLMFDRAAMRRMQSRLSSRLTTLITAYLDVPASPDEAPVINGDPFTDSQEYPARFGVHAARLSGVRADVLVEFADGWSAKSLRYHLRREGAQWRVDDIVYPGGGTFTQLLREGIHATASGTPALPAWAQAAWDRESRRHALVRDSSLSPAFAVADFDGDGRDDVAWIVQHRTTHARGILIAHARARAAQLCGAGITCGNGGNDFAWMDTWRVVPRHAGRGFALLVEKSEAGGGRIEFSRGRYRWLQVGD